MGKLCVGVFGATGQVGAVMVDILAERALPLDELRLFASSRSAGSTITWQGRPVAVEDVATASLEGIDFALLAVDATTARVLAPKLVAAGAVVIDNSSAWRMDPKVPLVVAGVNDAALSAIDKGIVANPNCTTMVAMPVLSALHQAAGLRSLVVSTYQAVSGAGRDGIAELEAQVRQAASGDLSGLVRDPSAVSFEPAAAFPSTIAFNVVPQAGTFMADGSEETDEDQKFRNESAKILNLPALAVSVLCVRVPVLTGHSMAINARFERPINPEGALRVLEGVSDVVVADVPTPLDVVGGDVTVVGRLRRDDTVEAGHGLAFFLSGDNLRKGAALNAVQIVEELLRRLRLAG